MSKPGRWPENRTCLPVPDEGTTDWVIWAAWADCITFEEIEAKTGLSAAERRRNLRHAFTWRGPSLQGVEVWLLDDVLTTGTTAAACTRVLKRAGASRVVVWVAARVA